MSSNQDAPNELRPTRHILFLKSIQLHEGYWLADSQASIQSLYTSTGSDRSEEQQIKDKKKFNFKKFKIIVAKD